MLDTQEVSAQIQSQDDWANLTVEGQIQVLKDTKQAHLNALVKLHDDNRMGTSAWYERLADLRTINSELKHLNGG